MKIAVLSGKGGAGKTLVAVNLAAVAREVGFEDPNYFSKCFRQSEGITPSEFIQSAGRAAP